MSGHLCLGFARVDHARIGLLFRKPREKGGPKFVFVIAAVSVPLLGGAAHAQMTQ
jgi:hypothetical protein